MYPTACDAIADIVQNAFEAGAARVELNVEQKNQMLHVSVSDNGRGMDAPTLARALDPFCTDPHKHPARKVGLGLPFLKEAASLAGGTFHITSQPGKGTTVSFSFDLTHIDAPPLGNAPATFTALMAYPGPHTLFLSRSENNASYTVSSADLRNALGGDLQNAGAIGLMRNFFAANENEIHPTPTPPPLPKNIPTTHE